ncbi:hypothetical protein [Clostridium sp. AWRP]|uniref:hypothetical protein n=1 Tax=Clostridium sp. AWRP TaxID=2212991 RepID=UPI000FDB199E|nr:hypothetical protein [Clostridium sp. AWRP]AZV55293.1 hypothetical protein DMR38_01000 [Clostridium sp. AWRP]
MVFETNISIAIINPEGKYCMKDFSIFDTNKINESFTSLKVSYINNGVLSLKIKCGLCGSIHYYKYNINKVVKKNIIIGGCELLGFPIFCIGNRKSVEEKILRYTRANKKIYAMI